MVINRQNYGYMLRKVRKVNVATYVAKMVFDVGIPKWNVTFNDGLLRCTGTIDPSKIQINARILDVFWMSSNSVNSALTSFCCVLKDVN